MGGAVALRQGPWAQPPSGTSLPLQPLAGLRSAARWQDSRDEVPHHDGREHPQQPADSALEVNSRDAGLREA